MPAHFLGFYGSGQPASSSEAAVTTTVPSAVATTSATNSSPYGYAQTQADALVTNVNALRVDVLALATLVNQLRADLVSLGLIKGSA